MLTASQLQELGFKVVFWPCTSVYTVTKAFGTVMRQLREQGTTTGSGQEMLSFEQFNEFIGLNAYNELDQKYK